MSTVIKIENVSKQYRLGLIGTNTLKGDLQRWWYNVRGLPDPTLTIGQENALKNGNLNIKDCSEYVWALKDINFEVEQGEVLGIIGKNGAGKSTLLKLLSRVTAPTTGLIKVKGRIASLLEVGTGFHPDLTGRENIFLNGAILGMTKTEIRSKLEEIVDFAGIAKYIDTPVKRYSSGMYVRLAFAVAAHLEPEILVIDEVLAVGDAEFQKKALGKMKNISKEEGRTVLFVSHNMAAVKNLCKSAILLQNGIIYFEGNQADTINKYLSLSQTDSNYLASGPIDKWLGNNNVRIKSFTISPGQGNGLSISSGVNFQMEFYNYKRNINLDTTFELSTFDEVVVFHHGRIITNEFNSKEGIYKIDGKIPAFFLNAGSYKMKVIFGENQRYPLYIQEDIVAFEIMNEVTGSNNSVFPGVVRANISYSVSFTELA
jgi:lipopolysaccharide transport system ATP-binding protein